MQALGFSHTSSQFAREIDQTTDIFEHNKHAPPVTKNQPPIAGSIKWARALLARLKQTMIKLHSTEEEIIRTTGALSQHCIEHRCVRRTGHCTVLHHAAYELS